MDFILKPLGFSARTIYCIGRNYALHAKELGNAVPTEPIVFLKPLSALCGAGSQVSLPRESHQVDHEVEVVVAIAKEGKNIPVSRALEHLAGYAVGVDLTARDLQEQAKKKGLPWTVSKGFDGFAPLSEFSSSPDWNPSEICFSLSVNGQKRQWGNTQAMLFPIPHLIAYLSGIFTLQRGDLIFTGTPAGVGPLKAGDQVDAELMEKIQLSFKVI